MERPKTALNNSFLSMVFIVQISYVNRKIKICGILYHLVEFLGYSNAHKSFYRNDFPKEPAIFSACFISENTGRQMFRLFYYE